MPTTRRLIVVEPSGSRREVEVTASPFRIGRQADNDLTLRDSRISRQQAQILSVSGTSVLEDMASRHGTFVNGEKILRRELQPNDKIEFGVPDSYRVIYVGDGATIEELVGRVDAPAPAQAGARELHHLGVLLDVARALGTGLSLEDILTVVLDAAIRLTSTERGVLLLLTGPSSKLQTAVARNAKRETLRPEELQVSESIVRRVANTRRELIVGDSVGDAAGENPQNTMARLALRTVVAIPIDKLPVIETLDATIMSSRGEFLGVLYLDSHEPLTVFSDLDREVLRTLAREAATVIENARLFSESRAKARLDHEIEIASEIQQRLLPRTLPDRPEISVAGSTIACYSVGGDCFDVIELGDRHGFFVGDVSGKGISAALLATLLQGVFFTTAKMDIPICDIFSRVNQYLCERTIENRYATIFYGVLDPIGRLEYVNAGHVSPLIRRRGGSLEELGSANFPVGLFPEAAFESARIALAEGDFLVIYTDGVSEAVNVRQEMFDERRLRQIVVGFQGQTAEELAEAIRAGVRDFTQGAPQSDDITLLVVQYKGNATGSPSADRGP